MGVHRSATSRCPRMPILRAGLALLLTSMVLAWACARAWSTSAAGSGTPVHRDRIFMTGERLTSAEVFRPNALDFKSVSAPMNVPRFAPIAAPLNSGRILIAGDFSDASAELFDPDTGSFTTLPSNVTESRWAATAATLHSGRVLIVGGLKGYGRAGLTESTAEVFDPKRRVFLRLASHTTQPRFGAIAASLPDGEVLIGGGCCDMEVARGAETFNPRTGKFEAVRGKMVQARSGAIAAPLPDGKVLIAGGVWKDNLALSTAEIFNPKVRRFTRVRSAMTEPRQGAAAAPLADGSVLIVGGDGAGGGTAELFDPQSGRFTALRATLARPRSGAVAAPLPHGQILIAGGQDASVNRGVALDLQQRKTLSYVRAHQGFHQGPDRPAG